MTYREFVPTSRLRGLVECGWTAVLPADEPARVQDVLPDGCMDLIWSDGEVLVAGPDTMAHPARREPGAVTVGLRFAPGALPGLLGVPAAVLRDQRVPIAELHPGPVRVADGPAAAAEQLSTLALALPGRGTDRTTSAVAARIAAGHGVATTADFLGWTTRTLHRHCLDAFGYGPSVLRRVLRFRRAVALLQAGQPPAAVAARAGYADQPHLSREVRALAGVSPGQLASGANRSTVVPSGSCATA